MGLSYYAFKATASFYLIFTFLDITAISIPCSTEIVAASFTHSLLVPIGYVFVRDMLVTSYLVPFMLTPVLISEMEKTER